MQFFVRSGALLGFPELVRSYGGNPTDLLREAGLSTAVLHDSELYLPYVKLAELFTRAAQQCDAADFGVQLGSRQGLQVVGALGSLMALQASLPDALQLMQKNLDFHARGVTVTVEPNDEFIDMRMAFAFQAHTDCSQLTALSMTLLCHCVAQLQQQPLPPLEAQLNMDESCRSGAYETAFACPVHFNAADNRLRYPAHLLRQKVDINPQLRALLSRQWRGDWRLSEPVSLGQQIERAISALLPTGECSLAMVAKVVDMQPRSLQMALKKQQSSFAMLLQRTRLRLACQYLRSSDIDLTTLAMNLGFAELAVFSRAFKQWTGKSPRDWRRKAADEF